MTTGFIGLGKMGEGMVERLVKAGHEVIVFDRDRTALDEAARNGATIADDHADLVARVKATDADHIAIVWLMIPSNRVDAELDALIPLAGQCAIIVDGGNSDFRLTQKRAERCRAYCIQFVDVGTSGGVLGRENGYALMVGGESGAAKILAPLFDALAPKDGWHYFGKSGAGHYVKMVHNAIEYGLMQAYAEGYRMLKEGPFRGIDPAAAGKVWQNGSVIESFLNDLAAQAVAENPDMAGVSGYVTETGETRWSLEAAKNAGLSLPVIEESFNVRLRSQEGDINYATKLLAVLRNKFGGHAINPAE
jgi:6-phosphogluconate dehydrogenase